MPAIVGANGIENLIPMDLSMDEQIALQESGKTLRAVLDDVL